MQQSGKMSVAVSAVLQQAAGSAAVVVVAVVVEVVAGSLTVAVESQSAAVVAETALDCSLGTRSLEVAAVASNNLVAIHSQDNL